MSLRHLCLKPLGLIQQKDDLFLVEVPDGDQVPPGQWVCHTVLLSKKETSGRMSKGLGRPSLRGRPLASWQELSACARV